MTKHKMSKAVIIAEKPSLAKNIVAGIGKMSREDGYYENDNYIVTWAFGHLFTLCDVETYNPPPPGTKFWTLDNLPCFPEKYKFEIKNDAGIKKQFGVIQRLVNRTDVDTIVNAGDADREGEVIIRLCIMKSLKTKKNLKRLWLPDQTAETVAKELKTMKDEKEYNNLADEGFARQYMDWLFGKNLSRYVSIKSKSPVRVGRVISPIVNEIYIRDQEIKNFVPKKYYGIASTTEIDGEKIELVSKNTFDYDKLGDALILCDKYNREHAKVKSVESKRTVLSPGKLYSLSKLQNVLGKKHKMPMDESLQIIQKLYEDGYLTYPRTNSEYLATAEKEKIRKIVEIFVSKGNPVKFKDKKSIFDDSKIESHSALTPTYKIPDISKLSEKEKIVYMTVLRRFLAIFFNEDCIVNKTEMVISVGDYEDFTLKGSTVIQKGWLNIEENDFKDKLLPNLKTGDTFEVCFKQVEKKTSPPKHYTIETLNNFLKNPFRKEISDSEKSDDEEAEEYKAIFEGLELGTEATRTGIIKNACDSKYIRLKGDVYTILPEGEQYIKILDELGVVMDKFQTSTMSKALKSVYRGEISINEAVKTAEVCVQDVFNKNMSCSLFTGNKKLGKCPLCGNDVIKTKWGYGCTGYSKVGCKFGIQKEIAGKKITESEVAKLLSMGQTSVLKGFKSKKDTTFDARLKINETGNIIFVFDKSATKTPTKNKKTTKDEN